MFAKSNTNIILGLFLYHNNPIKKLKQIMKLNFQLTQ
jgi:hypothetical protein